MALNLLSLDIYRHNIIKGVDDGEEYQRDNNSSGEAG